MRVLEQFHRCLYCVWCCVRFLGPATVGGGVRGLGSRAYCHCYPVTWGCEHHHSFQEARDVCTALPAASRFPEAVDSAAMVKGPGLQAQTPLLVVLPPSSVCSSLHL